LIEAGLHAPVIPLSDIPGSVGADAPWHKEGGKPEKIGVIWA